VKVVLCESVRSELQALPKSERMAMYKALERLELHGDLLGYPHTSAVQGTSSTLRELRPRAGRSAWRAFYPRVGAEIVVGSIGPEAMTNPARFRRSVNLALTRLNEYQQVEGTPDG
jgi:hypothetical protein